MAEDEVHDGPDEDEDEDDFDALPGRPIGPNEIDPELIRLSRSRPRVGAITSAAIVVFCAYLMFTLRGDLIYSRAGDSPKDVTVEQITTGTVGADSYVRVEAAADRTIAVRVGTGEGDLGSRVVPVWGSNDKLWILVPGSTWSDMGTSGVYEGRLRSLGALPFAGVLKKNVADRDVAPRYVTVAAVRQALADRAGHVSQPGGDRVPVAADTPIDIEETRLDRTIIQVFSTRRHETEADWSAALAEAGIVAPGTQGTAQKEEDTWSYEVAMGIEAVREKLEEARLTAARAKPVVERRTAVWGDLASDQNLLGHNVEWVAVHVSRAIPGDAKVLLTNEKPGTYWYLLPLYGILVVFAGLFVWALVRALKPDRQDIPIPAEPEADPEAAAA